MPSRPASSPRSPGGTSSATSSSASRAPTKSRGRSNRVPPPCSGGGTKSIAAPPMKRYIVHRLLQGVVLLCMVAAIVFFLGRLTGNPVDLMLPEDATPADRAAMIKAFGLDGPVWQQFAIFVGNALHGDLGQSIRMRQPAVEAFFSR